MTLSDLANPKTDIKHKKCGTVMVRGFVSWGGATLDCSACNASWPIAALLGLTKTDLESRFEISSDAPTKARHTLVWDTDIQGLKFSRLVPSEDAHKYERFKFPGLA